MSGNLLISLLLQVLFLTSFFETTNSTSMRCTIYIVMTLKTLEWEEREVVEVYDPEGTLDTHVDPNPIPDEEGNLYMAFFYNDQAGDPAGCQEHPCQKSFRVARENRK